jgi:hypothetical protein
VNSAAFSPDGKRIVTASNDEIARIWDAATGQAIAILEGHTRPLNSAAFSPDGQRIVTASSDKTARIWDASRSETVTSLRTVILAAALAHGVGRRTGPEGIDLLMQDADDDLYAESLRQLGRAPDDREVADAAVALAAPLHPNCYLSPTQFAEKFKIKGERDGEASPSSNHNVNANNGAKPTSTGHALETDRGPESAQPSPQHADIAITLRWPRVFGLAALALFVAGVAVFTLGHVEEIAVQVRALAHLN